MNRLTEKVTRCVGYTIPENVECQQRATLKKFPFPHSRDKLSPWWRRTHCNDSSGFPRSPRLVSARLRFQLFHCRSCPRIWSLDRAACRMPARWTNASGRTSTCTDRSNRGRDPCFRSASPRRHPCTAWHDRTPKSWTASWTWRLLNHRDRKRSFPYTRQL